MKKTSFFSPDLPCSKNVCYERQAITYQNYMTLPRQRVFRYHSIIVDWVSIVIDRFTFHMFFKRRKRMRCWMVRNPKGAFELGLSRSQYFFFSFISIFHHYHYHCYYYYHYIFSKIFNSIFCENSYRINDNQFFIRSSHKCFSYIQKKNQAKLPAHIEICIALVPISLSLAITIFYG